MKSADLRLVSCTATHVGHVRTVNEDSFLDRPGVGMFAVADGMGGHEAGDFASRLIIQTLSDVDAPGDLDPYVAVVRDALETANVLIRRTAENKGEDVIIGSTVVVLLVCGRRFACLWAGDSRLYRYRDGALALLTRDHTALEDMIAAGASADDAASSAYGNALTRAIGAFDTIEPDLVLGEIETGDRFLLCSDGLTRMISDRKISEVLAVLAPEAAAEALIAAALARGGRDNVTAIIASVLSPAAC